MNAETAEKAEKAQRRPFVIVNPDRVDKMPPYPFPNYGTDYEPPGWEWTEELWTVSLVNKQGDGMAYGFESFREVLRARVRSIPKDERRKFGFAIISTGPFAVNIGLFRKVEDESQPT